MPLQEYAIDSVKVLLLFIMFLITTFVDFVSMVTLPLEEALYLSHAVSKSDALPVRANSGSLRLILSIQYDLAKHGSAFRHSFLRI